MSGQKRVLFVVDKSGFGGIQTIAYTLMNQEFPDDIDMSYLFLRNLNSTFGMKEVDRKDVFYSRSRGRYSLLSFLELYRIIRYKKIDVLHLNGNKAILFGAVMKKLFFPRLRIIAHEHGGVFDYNPWYLRCVRLLRNRLDLFISLSLYRKDFLMTRCGVDGSKVRILYNFVDPARVRVTDDPGGDRGGGTPGKDLVIGYLGGLSRIKGCDVLIRAIPILKQQMSAFRVVVAGEGPARGELEALATTLGLNDSISFLGYVEQPATAYTTFDLMVIPSRSEAGPMCLYEAWTMGLPVVASNAPVLNEIIEDGVTGILFESEDPRDLAEKILLACRDKGLAGKIRAGSAREVAKHSVGQYLASLHDIYTAL